jgi:hypothetical protein
MTPRPTPLAAPLLLLVLSLGAPRALADDTQTVSLRDGTSVTGTVVEYIQGDHVTMQLPNGERRRLEWAALATPPSAPLVDTLPLSPEFNRLHRPLPAATETPHDDGASTTPQPDVEPEGLPSFSRVAFGLQTAYDSPFGPLALTIDYFPIQWIGVEGAVAMPIFDEPATLGESVMFNWRPGDPWGDLAIGFGVGVAQSFTKTIVPGVSPGVTNYLTLDVGHVELTATPHILIRGSFGLAAILNNADYCQQHPEACPELAEAPISATLSAMWIYDFAKSWR